MDIMSAEEAAHKWGISQRCVVILCSEGRIEQAKLVGNSWVIPATAVKPNDAMRFRNSNQNCGRTKPFIKWAGGKGQLLSEINKYYPFADGKITRYAEPFVGGGAVLFDILGKYKLDEVYLSDINRDLVNAYIAVQNKVDRLIKLLKKIQIDYINLKIDNRKVYYANMREKFNQLKSKNNTSLSLELAALFIFLNKTCFNGLYRVNRKGQFNVPMGAYKNPIICDEVNLRLVSQKLQGIKIVYGDYRQSAEFIDNRTFVYFDPPYRPLSKTANFTAYSEDCFDDKKQIELAHFIHEIDKAGALVLLSNSDPKNINEHDDFFDCIYSNMYIRRVSAARMINSNCEARGKIKELLISNFKG